MAVGIIAEYNPFHNGHLYHINKTRAELGSDTPLVVVLSGDFVQRGEAAAFSKFARAEAALRCGASLVIELPLPWCLSSAEGFARGGIGLLAASGVVDTVSFGSESADINALTLCAKALDGDDFKTALHEQLKKGISFASAREKAAACVSGEAVKVLRSPNDLLGIEYIRAANNTGAELTFLPVKREGTEHDGEGSASYLRSQMEEGREWLQQVPAPAAEVFRRETDEGRGPVRAADLRQAIMSRLRMLREEEYALLPDAAEGLDHRLYKAVCDSSSPEAAAMAAKSKRYALSRLRRMLLCAALGVRKDDAQNIPPYIRVLAMDEKGMAVLKTMRTSASLPVISKPAHIRRLDERAQTVFDITGRAHDLYVLGYADDKQHTAMEDWRTSPIVV